MIAISSARLHSKSEAYRTNQIRAKKSWEAVFDRIVYFGDVESELTCRKTVWMPSCDWPHIHTLADYASRQKSISCIINADIVVTAQLINVFRGMSSSYILGMTSRRYDLESGELNPEDRGRDIFILKPHAWKMVADEVPRSCRIGHNEWDSWMIGFMRKKFGKKFADFTRCRCIFHPQHEERERPFGEEVDISGPYKGYWDGKPDTQIIINETPRVAIS